MTEVQLEMSKVHANTCGCCHEIYNETVLVKMQLGKNTLRLCPECYEELMRRMKLLAPILMAEVSQKE